MSLATESQTRNLCRQTKNTSTHHPITITTILPYCYPFVQVRSMSQVHHSITNVTTTTSEGQQQISSHHSLPPSHHHHHHLDAHMNTAVNHHILPHHYEVMNNNNNNNNGTTSVTMDTLQQQRKKIHAIAEFVAGAFGGLAGICVGYPLDTIKTRSRFINSNS